MRAKLGDLQRLRELRLSYTDVGDDTLEVVGRFRGLKWLSFAGTQCTDDGVRCLCTLSELEFLSLQNTTITGGGFAEGASLASLKTLNLSGCPLEGYAMTFLAELPSLEELFIAGTEISASCLLQLRHSRPGLRIHRLEPLPAGENCGALNADHIDFDEDEGCVSIEGRMIHGELSEGMAIVLFAENPSAGPDVCVPFDRIEQLDGAGRTAATRLVIYAAQQEMPLLRILSADETIQIVKPRRLFS